MSAKFDEFPSLPFQDIKEKPKCHGRTDGRTHGRMDNVKTVYPPTNVVCGGIITDLTVSRIQNEFLTGVHIFELFTIPFKSVMESQNVFKEDFMHKQNPYFHKKTVIFLWLVPHHLYDLL